MREVIRHLIDDARRSGDRIGVDGKQIASTQVAAELIRLARVATSIHLAESARLIAGSGPVGDRVLPTREPVQ